MARLRRGFLLTRSNNLGDLTDAATARGNLGLADTATALAAIDDSLLMTPAKVGSAYSQHGLGAELINKTELTNLNNPGSTKFFMYKGTASAAPPSGQGGSGIGFWRSPGLYQQIAIEYETPRIWARTYFNSAWSAWEEIITSANLTGSMATNGRSSLPNGFIEQWGSQVGASTGTNGTETITFPVTFPNALVALQGVEYAGSVDDATTLFAMASSSTTSTGYLYWRKDSGSSDAGISTFRWRAIGF